MQEAEKHNRKVLFLCTSQTLSDTVKKDISLNPLITDKVDVYCISQLFQKISVDFESYEAPLYEGIEESIDANMKYDAIFVDEAQDFTEEWARITRSLLADQSKSRLGIFYDDVQIFREDSFGNGFGIVGSPIFFGRISAIRPTSIHGQRKGQISEKMSLSIQLKDLRL